MDKLCLPLPTFLGVGENELAEDDDNLFQTEGEDEFDDKGMPTAEHQHTWMDEYKENHEEQLTGMTEEKKENNDAWHSKFQVTTVSHGVIGGSKKRQQTE